MELKSTLEALIKIPEGWELCTITPYKAAYIWEHIKDKDALFPDGSFRTYEACLISLQRSVVYLHDRGYVRFDHIMDSLSAQMHGVIWRGSLSKYANEVRSVIASFFLLYPIRRVYCQLPVFCRSAKRALEERVGFALEGTMRSAVKYKGQFYDEYLFSILDTEVTYVW